MWPTAAFAYSFTMPTVLQFRWVGRGVREGRGGPRENSRIPARLTALDYRVFGVRYTIQYNTNRICKAP